MKRFKRILVVFDSKTDNHALFNQALDLVQRNNASLTVVDIIEEAPVDLVKGQTSELTKKAQKSTSPIIENFQFDNSDTTLIAPEDAGLTGGDNTTDIHLIDIQERIKQDELQNFQQFLADFNHAGIQVNSKTIVGVPFIEIIREVLRNHHDLVMITAEGNSNLKEALFGNTTMHLMRKCPCPVWVIKPDQPSKFNRILAAVDLAQDDLERAALAAKILELASSQARSGNSELLIFHAWNLYGESVLRGRGGIASEVMEKLLHDTKDAHRQRLVDLFQNHPLDDLKHEIYLLKGDAGTLISKLVQAKSIDLVVMGSVSRSGIAGFLIGNTAEKVLHQVDCSVLTIKPEGFITPVTLT
jgi:nucleotide-binding universal stress UspA family protein